MIGFLSKVCSGLVFAMLLTACNLSALDIFVPRLGDVFSSRPGIECRYSSHAGCAWSRALQVSSSGLTNASEQSSRRADSPSTYVPRPGGELDLFPYKNPDDPIFIVVTGQSNAVQMFRSRVPMARNTLVWDWATGGEGDGNGNPTGPWFWQIPDPNAPLKADLGSGIVTGYPQGLRGGAAWGLADNLAKATGRRVYMVCTAMGGQPISQWEPGVGAVGLELDWQVNAAMRALQVDYPGITFADVVVWIQGEQDAASGTAPELYAERWLAWRDHVTDEANFARWAQKQLTKWYVVQITRDIAGLAAWKGHQHIYIKTGGRVRVVSSHGKETIEGLHFWGDQATSIGADIAKDVVAGAE